MDMFSNKEEIIIDHHIDGGPATTEGVTPEKLTFWYISVPSGIFLGEMHRHMSHEEEQKNFFCCSPKARTSLAKAKQVFLFFQMMKMSCIDPKMPFF